MSGLYDYTEDMLRLTKEEIESLKNDLLRSFEREHHIVGLKNTIEQESRELPPPLPYKNNRRSRRANNKKVKYRNKKL